MQSYNRRVLAIAILAIVGFVLIGALVVLTARDSMADNVLYSGKEQHRVTL